MHTLLWSLLACVGSSSSDVGKSDSIGVTPPRDPNTPRTGPSILPGEVTGPGPAPDVVLAADQCHAMADGGPVMDDCLTGFIHCGSQVVGDTLGGVDRFTTKFYEKNQCTPATTNHDGGDERVYLLDLPNPRTRARVTLDTPCADLDLAAVRAKEGTCPDLSTEPQRCEENRKNGTEREFVDLYETEPARWYVIVEGVTNNEGAFGLTVQCADW